MGFKTAKKCIKWGSHTYKNVLNGVRRVLNGVQECIKWGSSFLKIDDKMY